VNILIDTHILLWVVNPATAKINRRIKALLEDPQNRIMVSVISLWEIGIKSGLGKISFHDRTSDDLLSAIAEMDFEIIELLSQNALSYYRLPAKETHKDPFDRMLIWQAISNNYYLLSQDRSFEQYLTDGLRLA
jgi:PIN domain nuclease of toxin-antitoxin system